MSDIAREAAVSKNTVSLALREDPQIPERTRKRIRKIAEQMGYRRNPTVAHLMAELRSQSNGLPRATIALLNVNERSDAFIKHPTIPNYVAGCRRRAERLGYGLDTFWVYDPELNEERLLRILKTRGIRGIVLVGLMDDKQLPEKFSGLWHHYPCVVTGVRTRAPALSFACSDHHILTLRAFEKALELGYRRPGLVLDRGIDQLVEGRFTAGYQTGQSDRPKSRQLPPFYQVKETGKDRKIFEMWLEKHKPDVIFTLYNDVLTWLNELGYQVPSDIGLIQLEWRAEEPEWAGMNQHNELVGEAAIDMLVSKIHSGESGVPPYPRATLIGPTWVDGETVNQKI